MDLDRALLSSEDSMRIRYDDLNTLAYQKLKMMILQQRLKPGDKIQQDRVSRILGVSRTPVLKALHRLASENWVEHYPHRGFYVKQLTKRELAEIFDLREALEGLAAKQAALHHREAGDELEKLFVPFLGVIEWTPDLEEKYIEADRRFHIKLMELAENQLLCRINEMFSIYWFSYQRGLLRPPAVTLSEHLAIAATIKDGDAHKARELAMAHLEKSRTMIKLTPETDEHEPR